MFSTAPMSTNPFNKTSAVDIPTSHTQELFKLMGVSPDTMPIASANTIPRMNSVPHTKTHLKATKLNSSPISSSSSVNSTTQYRPRINVILQRGKEFLQITNASLEHPGLRLNVTYQNEPAIDSNGLFAESITAAFQQLVEANSFRATLNQTQVVREEASSLKPASKIKEDYERIGHLLAITASENQRSPCVLTNLPLDESLFSETLALSPWVEPQLVPNVANVMLDFAATCDLPLNSFEAHTKDTPKILQSLFSGAVHSPNDLSTILQLLEIQTSTIDNNPQTMLTSEPDWVADMACSEPIKAIIQSANQYFCCYSAPEFLSALVDETLPKLATARGCPVSIPSIVGIDCLIKLIIQISCGD